MSTIASEVRPVLFVALEFDDDPLYVNTTATDLEWDNKTWIGAGLLGGIGNSEQNIEMNALSLTVSLSGIPVSRIIEARNEKYRNRRGAVYFGWFDGEWAIPSDPLQIFSGKMDKMNISASGDMASIMVEIASPFQEWQRPKSTRYTNESLRSKYPNDLGFQYVPQMVTVSLPWRAKP